MCYTYTADNILPVRYVYF